MSPLTNQAVVDGFVDATGNPFPNAPAAFVSFAPSAQHDVLWDDDSAAGTGETGNDPFDPTDDNPTRVAVELFMAVDDAVSFSAGQTAFILGADLAANDIGADPTSIGLPGGVGSVTLPSGGTVAFDGSGFTYTPPAGPAVADSFTYQICPDLRCG